MKKLLCLSLVLFLLISSLPLTVLMAQAETKEYTFSSEEKVTVTATNVKKNYKVIVPKAGIITIHFILETPNCDSIVFFDEYYLTDAEYQNKSFYLDAGTYEFYVEAYDNNPKTAISFSFVIDYQMAENLSFSSGSTSFSNANKVSLNKKYYGFCGEVFNSWGNEPKRCYYMFTLSVPGRVVVKASKNITKPVWDKENLLNQSNFYFLDSSKNPASYNRYEPDNYIDLIAGTYYFVFDAAGYYSFELNYTKAPETIAEKYTNNTKAAKEIYINSVYNGQISSNDVADIYKIKLARGQKISINYNSNIDSSVLCITNYARIEKNEGEADWSVYIDNGYWHNVPRKGNKLYTTTLSSVGMDVKYSTYYFVIQGMGTGAYTLKISGNNPYLKKPTTLKCMARTTSSEKIAWSKVSGASGYQVQCSDGGNKWAQTKTGSSTSCTFKGLTAGGKYKFRVRAYKKINGQTVYSAWSSTLCSCAKPAAVTLESVSSPQKAKIKTTWKKAGGVVSGYQIYYGRNASFSSLAAKKNVSGKSTITYTGKNFTKGRSYYVKVRTYTVFNGVTYYGAWSAAKKVTSR